MAIKVIMPKQGLQMKKGTIRKWLINEGESIEAEAPLFEIETDKLTIEITSPASGTLLKIIRQEGEVVPITDTVAAIGEPDEDISDILAEAKRQASANAAAAEPEKSEKTTPSAAGIDAAPEISAEMQEKTVGPSGQLFITPRARMRALEEEVDINAITGTSPQGWIIERDVLEQASEYRQQNRATPLAAKIAAEAGLRISDIAGTGANGRVTRDDVEKAAASQKDSGIQRHRSTELLPFEGMRKVIADRMMESLHNSAQLAHKMKVDMTEIIRLRESYKQEGIKISINDVLIKIVSKTLLEFPMVNASLTEEGILTRNFVNMGIAVAVENGLIVPVIRDADLLSLQEISASGAALVEKAKSGSLETEDYTGGTFTITNLGMFDIDEFTAIINPPESAILAVGKIDKVPVVRNDEIVIRPIMTLSLTYDHRVVDGAPAAQFLQKVKKIIENPYLLL